MCSLSANRPVRMAKKRHDWPSKVFHGLISTSQSSTGVEASSPKEEGKGKMIRRDEFRVIGS